METKEIEQKEVRKVYGSFLEERHVSIKPVESSGKWNTLLVKGQEKQKDPFLYNKVKRSFQVPLNSYTAGGGVKVILDDQRRVLIAKFEEKYPLGVTQKEYFELELGVDLNPTLTLDKNFWRTNRLSRVMLTKEGLQLNLSIPLDKLRYLILLSNKSLIAPSYDLKDQKATYEFMIVDESKVTSKKIAEATIKAQAYAKFGEVTSAKESILGFIRFLGRTVPVSITNDWDRGKDWAVGEVLTILENDPIKFLEIVNHPQYKQRIFVQEAIEVGALLRKADKRYTLDTGRELGDITDVVNFLLDPENQEVKLRIKSKIELSKG